MTAGHAIAAIAAIAAITQAWLTQRRENAVAGMMAADGHVRLGGGGRGWRTFGGDA